VKRRRGLVDPLAVRDGLSSASIRYGYGAMGEVKRPTRDGPRECGRGHTTMERRKFVVGLGALASGSAAAMGTGAFTSVEADRSISIETAGDANAFLSFEKATDSDGNVTPNAQEYVELTGDNTVSFDFTNSDATNGTSGINKNAKSTFDNLIDIQNNGSQEIELSVESDLIASQGGFLGIYAENSQGDSSDNTGLSDSSTSQTTTLAPGEAATNIGIYVPKGSSLDQVESGTFTFIAERTGGNQD